MHCSQGAVDDDQVTIKYPYTLHTVPVDLGNVNVWCPNVHEPVKREILPGF